jgi:very-short-patch-repair endonuclease
MKKENVKIARGLRRASTEAEIRLWSRLRDRQLGDHKFARQEPIAGFIADFVCRRLKLVVELDGGQHSEHATYDARRTAVLQSKGYRVLRFWNNDVLSNTDGVLETILRTLESAPAEPPPHPDPLPVGERGT